MWCGFIYNSLVNFHWCSPVILIKTQSFGILQNLYGSPWSCKFAITTNRSSLFWFVKPYCVNDILCTALVVGLYNSELFRFWDTAHDCQQFHDSMFNLEPMTLRKVGSHGRALSFSMHENRRMPFISTAHLQIIKCVLKLTYRARLIYRRCFWTIQAL